MKNKTPRKTFNKYFIERVINYHSELKEVRILTVEDDLQKFSNDLDPEKELMMWETIAFHYEYGTLLHPEWDLTAKKEHFNSVLERALVSTVVTSDVKNCKV